MEKYQKYLPLIKNFNFSKKAEILGIQKQDQFYNFEFSTGRLPLTGRISMTRMNSCLQK